MPPEANKDEALIKRIDELVRENPRFGYRRIASMLCHEGWKVNLKRVYRLWRNKGYRVETHKTRKIVVALGPMPVTEEGPASAMTSGPMILYLIVLKTDVL